MPRYFFNIREGNHVSVDEEGMILPGLDAAEAEAEQGGGELLADMLREGTPLDSQIIEVTNEDGAILKRVGLKSLFWVSA